MAGLDLRELLFKGHAALAEAARFFLTGRSTAKWKESLSKQLATAEHFSDTFRLFSSMVAEPYYNEGMFLSRIWDFVQAGVPKLSGRRPLGA